MAEEIKLEDPELRMLLLNKESGYNYQQRRRPDWTDNYELFRDKVTYNRLTQRQSVNLPLMKTSMLTVLTVIDDLPLIVFENLDNEKESEIFQNEYWKFTGDYNNFEIQDIVDKKQEFLFGRTFDQWQIADGKIKMTVEDPMDILIDRYCDPTNIHSARYLIHTHIFVPLASLAQNPDYDQAEVRKLQEFYATEQGLIKKSENQRMMSEKNQKMADLGVPDIESPILGETYVELDLQFLKRETGQAGLPETIKEEQIYLYVSADDQVILMKKPLEEVIGTTGDHFWQNHYPYCTWAEDIERQDFWSDGKGDIIRTPNKILNSWMSQLVENRTLRNFGMHYYDSTIEGFTPSTFTPIPWGWYPIPGRPADVLQKVDIPDLSESLDEMMFVRDLVERATGATTILQGIQSKGNMTLGEIQQSLAQAQQAIKGTSKFYTKVWKDRALLFLKLIEAAPEKLDAVKIYKQGRNTNDMFLKEISPKDWMTESGYNIKIWAQDEKETQDTKSLEKMSTAVVNIPGNPKLIDLYQRKLLEFSGLNPDEINDIMQFETQKADMMQTMIENTPGGTQTPGGMAGQPTPQPAQPITQPNIPRPMAGQG